jgi:hypothetical protein
MNVAYAGATPAQDIRENKMLIRVIARSEWGAKAFAGWWDHVRNHGWNSSAMVLYGV